LFSNSFGNAWLVAGLADPALPDGHLAGASLPKSALANRAWGRPKSRSILPKSRGTTGSLTWRGLTCAALRNSSLGRSGLSRTSTSNSSRGPSACTGAACPSTTSSA
jgi:hypothetical protein